MQLYLKTLSVVFVCVNICIKGDFNLIFTESRLSPGSLKMLDFHLAWQPAHSEHFRFDQYSLKINDIILFYRTHVHMGSDHWVAMSVTQYIQHLFFTLVDDPS